MFLFIFVFPFLVSSELEKVFVLELHYNHGVVKQGSLHVAQLFFSEKKDQPETSYIARLLSANKEELYQLKFMFPIDVTDLPVQELEEAIIDIYLPYKQNAYLIEIYSPEGNKLIEIPLRYLVENLCGDGVCDSGETYESCSIDCGKPQRKITNKNHFLIFLIGVFIVVLIICTILYIRKKSSTV